MAITVQRNAEAIAYALVKGYNALRHEVAVGLTKVHADITSQSTTGGYMLPSASAYLVTAATPTDLATLITGCRDIYRVYATHAADTAAHAAADGTNTIASGLLDPTTADQSAVNTFLNQAKTAYNAHRSQSGVHDTNDAGNSVAAANATDQASAITLFGAIKTALNAHIQASLTSPAVVIVG